MNRIVAVILMLVLAVASATAGIRHYFDYVGSIRAIVNTDGEVEQTVDYLSTGIPIKGGKGEIIDDRLHTGKPFLDMNGLGYYDNNARFLDILTGGFISRDALAGSYPNLSPYANCANNPLIYIDPDGRVLRDKNGEIIYVTNREEQQFKHASGAIAVLEIGYIFTDNNTPIQVLNNVNEYPGWDTNCHGTTFVDGKFWMNNDQVKTLLQNDNYDKVNINEAKKFDKIIYYGDGTSGQAEHSMTIVRTNGSLEGTIVYGQGGLLEENYVQRASKEWINPTNSEIVRKEQQDKQLSDNEINELKKDFYE